MRGIKAVKVVISISEDSSTIIPASVIFCSQYSYWFIIDYNLRLRPQDGQIA